MLRFFFNDTATTEIYTLSLHDALPISNGAASTTRSKRPVSTATNTSTPAVSIWRSEEHTSELQSLRHLVCRLLLGKKSDQSPELAFTPVAPRCPRDSAN